MAMQLFYALFTVLIGVGGCLAYFWGSNAILDVLLPVNASNDDRSIRNLKLQSLIRPWLFLFPAMILLTIYLIYPVFQTIWLSFHDKAGDAFVGFDNYRWAFNDTGFRHHQKKDYQVSRELFLKATWANPTAPLPPYNLACAYALTNDAIRVGARFETIVGNVREVVEARRGVGLDLRIGLSVVVMAENVTRLPSLVELAARLGVDWVKLEEAAPATP